MTHELKVRRVGTSIGMILPRKLLHRTNIELGDKLLAIETSDGILIRRHDSDLVNRIKKADAIIERETETLMALLEADEAS